MNLLLVTADLIIITAVSHLLTPFIYRESANARPVAVFGAIYLALGILLWFGVGPAPYSVPNKFSGSGRPTGLWARGSSVASKMTAGAS